MTEARARRPPLVTVMLLTVITALAASSALAAPADDSPAGVGRALFDGSRPLVGRINGHTQALPAVASRCINCHRSDAAPASTPSVKAARVDEQRLGPTLGAAFLKDAQRRRGGPPSAYATASFCQLLRTGIDPAYVIIDRTMPRYDLDDAGCKALWLYLTQTHS